MGAMKGDGFPFDDAENPAQMPKDMIILGAVFRDSSKDGGAIAEVISDPFSALWEFPNYHDKGNRQAGVTMMPINETFAEECNTAALPPDDPRRADFICLRNLARPRTSGPGVYRVGFGLDRAGNYTLSVTFKGTLGVDESGNQILGPHVKGSPYLLTVLPGPSRAMFTTVTGPALKSLTVGELNEFTIIARDRFGNRRTEGGDNIDVVFKGAEYVKASLPHDSTLPQWDTLDSQGRMGYTSYSNITDFGDGSYSVQVYVVKRIRSQPNYTLEVDINLDPVPTCPCPIEVFPAPTSAAESFAIYEPGVAPVGTFSTNGLDYAVAGEAALFSIQARDRFQNLQDVYRLEQYTYPGDPFFLAVLDLIGACGYDHAFPEEPGAGQVGSGIPPGCNSLATDSRGTDMLAPLPATGLVSLTPHVSVTFDGEKGRYTVIFKAYRAGNATVNVQLYNQHVGPIPESPPGTTGSPFSVLVQAGPTWPANCIAYGDVLNGFVAGEAGPQGRGLSYLLQLRDRFGNNRTEAEAAYLGSTTDNYPWPTFRLSFFCTQQMADLGDNRCDGILLRDTDNGSGEDGIRRFIYEVPVREGGPVVFSPVDNTVDIAKTMDYVGNGLFETVFTTDLAGLYDMQV